MSRRFFHNKKRLPYVLSVTVFFCGLLIAANAMACSPPPSESMYKKLSSHEKVFVGTIGGSVSGDLFKVHVDEAFKGVTTNTFVTVKFETSWCSIGDLKNGGRYLIFMSGEDKVSVLNGSHRLWRESEAKQTWVDLDDVVLLRRMLDDFENAFEGVAKDEETAIYLGIKAMIAVYGKQEVEKYLPYTAKFQGYDSTTKEELGWQVTGTVRCGENKLCSGGTPKAQISKITGEVIQVSHEQ